MQNNVSNSNLILNQRKELNLTGVKKIKSTQPHLVIAQLDNGTIIIKGTNITIDRVDIKEGILELNGQINSINYTNQISKGFSLKNIFK